MADSKIDISNITIRSPTPDDLPALRLMVPDVFSRKEPMLSYAKTSVAAFLTGYDQLASNFDFHTSTIATLPGGEIVAGFFGIPFGSPVNPAVIDQGCLDLYQFLINLDMWFVKEFDLMGAGKEKRVLHLVMGTTVDEYENRGISKRLRAETIRKAKEAGWDYALVECSNLKTQHLMRDVFGFQVGTEARFTDHEVDGRKPLEGMEGTALLLYSDLKK